PFGRAALGGLISDKALLVIDTTIGSTAPGRAADIGFAVGCAPMQRLLPLALVLAACAGSRPVVADTPEARRHSADAMARSNMPHAQYQQLSEVIAHQFASMERKRTPGLPAELETAVSLLMGDVLP